MVSNNSDIISLFENFDLKMSFKAISATTFADVMTTWMFFTLSQYRKRYHNKDASNKEIFHGNSKYFQCSFFVLL